VLNTVSARLDSASLRALNAQVENTGRTPRQVADSWLRAHGLIPGGDRQ
jgi:glycine betaine/choline ABC-type transport system substrate-binding protein